MRKLLEWYLDDLVVLEPHENFNVLSLSGKLVVYEDHLFHVYCYSWETQKRESLEDYLPLLKTRLYNGVYHSKYQEIYI